MLLRICAWIAALAALAAAAPAHACSVREDYFRPSNFELVQLADAIVVAVAEEEPAAENGLSQLDFRIETAIKGAPSGPINLLFGTLGQIPPSDNEDLSSAHPQSLSGACNRTIFAQGGRYLLFLEQNADGYWTQLGYPFSRISEDYSGEDNSWVSSVRRYLRLQQELEPMEQIAALTRMAESGQDSDGSRLSPGEREDIFDHLRTISPWKPTAFLLDLHSRLERGEPLPFGPRTRPDNAEEGYARAAAELLDEPVGAEPSAADGLRWRVLLALAEGEHPDAMTLFERLWSAPSPGPRERGLMLRWFARNGQYPRAYRWIETRLLAELPRFRRDDAMRLLADVAAVQRGDSWDEGRERWRSDPHAAATWPSLARRLDRYQVRTFGAEYALPFFDE